MIQICQFSSGFMVEVSKLVAEPSTGQIILWMNQLYSSPSTTASEYLVNYARTSENGTYRPIYNLRFLLWYVSRFSLSRLIRRTRFQRSGCRITLGAEEYSSIWRRSVRSDFRRAKRWSCKQPLLGTSFIRLVEILFGDL